MFEWRPVRRGTIVQVTGRPAEAQHLSDLAWLRRVRDRIDREYAQPLDVVQEPTDQPYGIRDCAVRDPAGNLIRINQL